MSDTNGVALRFRKETTAGTMVTGAYDLVPFTGSSDLGATPETVVSDIIRSDRQVTDLIKVNESIGGQFDTELMPGALNPLLLGMLQAASWGTEAAVVSSGTVTVASGSPTSTFTRGSGTDFATVGDGEFVEVKKGSSAPSYYRVVSATNTVLTVQGPVSEATGSDIVISRGAHATNGSTSHAFSFERKYTDQASPTYEYLTGLEVDTFSLTAAASSLVTASFGMLGRKHTVGTSRGGSVTDGSDNSATPFNASTNVATIGEAGAPGLQVCTELTMEVANNLRQLNVIGVEGASSVGAGEFNVTGSLSVYFDDKTLLEKLLENTATSISFGFSDGTGNALLFEMPAVKFTEGVPEVSGKNEDVMLNLGYQAYRDATLGYTLRVTRFTSA